MVNEDGRFVDENGDFIDIEGNQITEDGDFKVEFKGFTADDGTVVGLKEEEKVPAKKKVGRPPKKK